MGSSLLLNPYQSFPAAGGGGAPALPSSAVFAARAEDLIYASGSRQVTGVNDLVSGAPSYLTVTGNILGGPGIGAKKLGALTTHFEFAGLDGADMHFAIAFRWQEASGTPDNTILLGNANNAIYLGVCSSGNGSSADQNASRGAVRMNATDFSGTITRDQAYTASGISASGGTSPSDINFFAYENPTNGSDNFRPLYYVDAAFDAAVDIMAWCAFSDWGELDDVQAWCEYVPTSSAYRYWGIRITDTDGTGGCSITRLDFKDASGAILTDETWALTNCYQSTVFSTGGSWNPAHLHDQDNATFTTWLNRAVDYVEGHWHMYDFGSDTDVASVDIRSTPSSPTLAPKDFEIFKSQDGYNWEVVRSVTGETGWTSGGETRSFDLVSPFSP